MPGNRDLKIKMIKKEEKNRTAELDSQAALVGAGSMGVAPQTLLCHPWGWPWLSWPKGAVGAPPISSMFQAAGWWREGKKGMLLPSQRDRAKVACNTSLLLAFREKKLGHRATHSSEGDWEVLQPCAQPEVVVLLIF